MSADNPLDFVTRTSQFEPILTEENVKDLQSRVKSLPPEVSEVVIQQIDKVIKENGATNQTLTMIMNILTGALGLGAKLLV